MTSAAVEPTPERLHFEVDSALLTELGERLVGRDYIALAELIKNSYDADADNVSLRVQKGLIVVSDNGHGMTYAEFKKFWMRIGVTHKVDAPDGKSRSGRRAVTGSKGIGRLAVQFLALEVRLVTVSESNQGEELVATVDWRGIQRGADLVKFQVEVIRRVRQDGTTFPGNSRHGLRLELRGLRDPKFASPDRIEKLGRETWFLRPFSAKSSDGLTIDFESSDPSLVEAYNRTESLWRRAWYARIEGECTSTLGKPPYALTLKISFADELATGQGPRQFEISLAKGREGDDLGDLYSLRYSHVIFNLEGRQTGGARLGDLKDFMSRNGGVYIYDAGFQLPFYGRNQDWLDLERDAASRGKASRLLPAELEEVTATSRAMTLLPSPRRILGEVFVDTNAERRRRAAAQEAVERDRVVTAEDPLGPPLSITLTRDRLVENSAYKTLRDLVRVSLDLYASLEYQRGQEEPDPGDVELPDDPEEAVRSVLNDHADQIDAETRRSIERELKDTLRAVEARDDRRRSEMGLLGALATAGMGMLAYDHELSKQLTLLEALAARLERSAGTHPDLPKIASDLRAWITRARDTRGLFRHLTDESSREGQARLRAHAVVSRLHETVRPLLFGAATALGSFDTQVFLPPAPFATWHAIFQNVYSNAANAMLGLQDRRIRASTFSERKGSRVGIRIEDTGPGVDLSTADELFQPFKRKQALPPEWIAAGNGGTGLGLTIVRMMAESAGCSVGFVPPSAGYATAFELSWTEKT